jgi:hypothetical protein
MMDMRTLSRIMAQRGREEEEEEEEEEEDLFISKFSNISLLLHSPQKKLTTQSTFENQRPARGPQCSRQRQPV